MKNSLHCNWRNSMEGNCLVGESIHWSRTAVQILYFTQSYKFLRASRAYSASSPFQYTSIYNAVTMFFFSIGAIFQAKRHSYCLPTPPLTPLHWPASCHQPLGALSPSSGSHPWHCWSWWWCTICRSPSLPACISLFTGQPAALLWLGLAHTLVLQ